ncbi:hypothetical protein K3M35_05240 [Rhodococcus sp. DMU2021]|uniref:hypothetical protein n=1 Tax=Rhodococcus sp. DMU2021 TaxID=2866997 RepID=UPI001C7DD5C2|nr:hypothetical protein [Rhodococcus sp. DMU2021]MBX4168071.1 hypothetical protein [Rhodococcus sp. DMU2021]
MSEQKRIHPSNPVPSAAYNYCGYGSCDKKPAHDGVHRCRCGKPVDEPHPGCEWHTPGSDWDRYVESELKKGHCPYSGELLSRNGEAGPDSMSCIVCDCFGFDPNDPRIEKP